MQQRPLVYLACPYSHDDPAVRRARFEAANRAAGQLMKDGHLVFSPISHTHPIAEAEDLPRGWEYWERFDRAYLAHCHRLVVLRIEGWQRSTGVTAEIAIAREMGLEIEYIDETPNVELTGSRAGLSPVSPATEGSEVERRVGGL